MLFLRKNKKGTAYGTGLASLFVATTAVFLTVLFQIVRIFAAVRG